MARDAFRRKIFPERLVALRRGWRCCQSSR
jgi:hypothetical protein